MEVLPIVKEGIESIVSDKRRVIGVYYPSTLPYCLRKEYYAYFEPEHLDFETRKTFAIGNAFHALIQKGLIFYKKTHPEVDIVNELESEGRTDCPVCGETFVHDEELQDHLYTEFYYREGDIELHGRPDSIILNESRWTVIEIKSHGNLIYLQAPEDRHMIQANFYMHRFEELGKPKDASLLYINKAKRVDGQAYDEFKEFANLQYDEGLFRMLVDRAWELHGKLQNQELPMPEAYLRGGTTDYECKNCQFRERCYKQIMETAFGKENMEALEKAITERRG